jgi:uncharacterized Zn-binding protein involved in type VI secretion
MPAVARQGDPTTTGHGCDGTTTVTGPTGAVAKVYANDIAVECKGNPTAAHTINSGNNCVPHGAVINVGSGNVFVGEVPVARVGDSTDGGKITAGSGTVFINGEGGAFGGGVGIDGGTGNVAIGPGGGGTVPRDPGWDYAAHSFFENNRHDYQYFAAEYAGMDYLPKTGNAALPLDTRRELLRDYAINVLGWAPDAVIPTGPDGEVSFTDPNYHPPVKLQDYINSVATEKGYLDSQGKSTLPLDYQQAIDQAQLASLAPYIQAQLARVNNGEQTLVNPSIPPIEEIAAAAAAAVANSASNPYRNEPNLIGGPVQDPAPAPATPEPEWFTNN